MLGHRASSFVTGSAFYLISCNNRLSETYNLHLNLTVTKTKSIVLLSFLFGMHFILYLASLALSVLRQTDLACETYKKLFLRSLAAAVLSDNCSLQTALVSHNQLEKPYNSFRVFRQVLHFHLATEKLFSDCERQVNP